MIECPCFYFELDPEMSSVAGLGIGICACGHTEDEHDENGDCQAEVQEI